MKFKIVESIEVDTAKREAELLSVLKKLSEREVLNLIHCTPSTAVPGDEFPFFITKDGRYIDVGEVSEINGSWAEDSVHADLFDILLEYVYDEYIDHGEYDFYTDWLGESEHDAAYSLLEDACEVLQWVRGNFGTSFVEDRLYFVLPTKVSTQQMYAVRNALAEMEVQKDEYQVFFDNGAWSVKYSFDEVSPDDFLNIMRRYYLDGTKPIGESINEEAGDTFPFPQAPKMQTMLKELEDNGYVLQKVSVKKLVDDNDLLNDKRLYAPDKKWNPDAKKYWFNSSRAYDWPYGEVMSAEEEADGKLRLNNGRHRCRAIWNDKKYDFIEIPVKPYKNTSKDVDESTSPASIDEQTFKDAFSEPMNTLYGSKDMGMDVVCERLYYDYGIDATYHGATIYVDDKKLCTLRFSHEGRNLWGIYEIRTYIDGLKKVYTVHDFFE